MTLPSDNDISLVPFLPQQRQKLIEDYLRRHGAVSLQQLAQTLRVSLSTLRRDLDSLAHEGVVDRTHGGAVLRHQQYSTFEPNPTAAAELNPMQKRLIGQAAAAALQPGQSVIFDSGSTVKEAARAVVERGIPLVAVTNDLTTAQLLGTQPLIQVHVIGGQLRPDSHTLVGESVLAGARAIHADVALMGAHALTDGVVSDTSAEVAAAKRALLHAANNRRLLIDSSKFRPRTFMSVCELGEFDEVITDEGIPKKEDEYLQSLNLRLTIVQKTP